MFNFWQQIQKIIKWFKERLRKWNLKWSWSFGKKKLKKKKLTFWDSLYLDGFGRKDIPYIVDVLRPLISWFSALCVYLLVYGLMFLQYMVSLSNCEINLWLFSAGYVSFFEIYYPYDADFRYFFPGLFRSYIAETFFAIISFFTDPLFHGFWMLLKPYCSIFLPKVLYLVVFFGKFINVLLFCLLILKIMLWFFIYILLAFFELFFIYVFYMLKDFSIQLISDERLYLFVCFLLILILCLRETLSLRELVLLCVESYLCLFIFFFTFLVFQMVSCLLLSLFKSIFLLKLVSYTFCYLMVSFLLYLCKVWWGFWCFIVGFYQFIWPIFSCCFYGLVLLVCFGVFFLRQYCLFKRKSIRRCEEENIFCMCGELGFDERNYSKKNNKKRGGGSDCIVKKLKGRIEKKKFGC